MTHVHHPAQALQAMGFKLQGPAGSLVTRVDVVRKSSSIIADCKHRTNLFSQDSEGSVVCTGWLLDKKPKAQLHSQLRAWPQCGVIALHGSYPTYWGKARSCIC